MRVILTKVTLIEYIGLRVFSCSHELNLRLCMALHCSMPLSFLVAHFGPPQKLPHTSSLDQREWGRHSTNVHSERHDGSLYGNGDRIAHGGAS